jgi:hypothetical protein
LQNDKPQAEGIQLLTDIECLKHVNHTAFLTGKNNPRKRGLFF